MSTGRPTGAASRDPGIDAFRGLAIVAMAVANYLEHIDVVPWWLKHKPDVGLTVIDFIAPFFVFAIGLTYGRSLRRRGERDGWRKAIEHTVARALALLGLGALFTLGEMGFGFNPAGYPWGTLQAIGVAILLSLPFLFLPWSVRLAAALVLLTGYQVLLDAFWLPAVVAAPQAGLPGSLSWAVLLILATVFADLWDGGHRARFVVLAAGLLACGVLLSRVVPVSKHRMSASFDLVVTGAAAAFSGILRHRVPRSARGLGILITWGRNPLVLYVAHLVLLAAFLVPSAPRWHVTAPAWQAAVQGVVFLAALHLGARHLHRRGIVVSL